MIRTNRCRYPCRHPYQQTLLNSGGERVVHSHRVYEPTLSGIDICLYVHQFCSRETPAVNAFLVALKVKANFSRGKSVMIGDINQPSPGGTSRVSETASHSICNP